MEPNLVLLAAGDEQDVSILDVQEPLDGVLAPHLAPVRLDVAPSVVRVDGLESAR
jgi:hypothetical protein